MMSPGTISKGLRKWARGSRNNPAVWRFGFNLGPTLSYLLNGEVPSGEAQRVLAELNRDGVAVTNAAKLLGPKSCFPELMETIAELEDAKAAELQALRVEANDTSTAGRKTFLCELLGSHPPLDPQSVYARFALQESILRVANAYFGMYSRLRYYNVWHTFASRAEARASQLWHHDREDLLILKLFVYFSDVDEGAGPFTYAAGSHQKGGLRRTPSCFLEGGVKRSEDHQMAEVVSPERWVKCTGGRGTIVFADTRGYHKGGLARTRDRIFYTCMFTSKASQAQTLFELPPSIEFPADRAQCFALSEAMQS